MNSFKIYAISFVSLLVLAVISIGASIGFEETLVFFKTNPVAIFGVLGAVAIATINPFYVYQRKWKAFIVAVVIQLLLCGLLFWVDMQNNGAWIATGAFVAFVLVITPITLGLRKAFGTPSYGDF